MKKRSAYSKAARQFMSDKIRLLMEEGYPQNQAIAISMSMARQQGLKVPPVSRRNPNGDPDLPPFRPAGGPPRPRRADYLWVPNDEWAGVMKIADPRDQFDCLSRLEGWAVGAGIPTTRPSGPPLLFSHWGERTPPPPCPPPRRRPDQDNDPYPWRRHRDYRPDHGRGYDHNPDADYRSLERDPEQAEGLLFASLRSGDFPSAARALLLLGSLHANEVMLSLPPGGERDEIAIELGYLLIAQGWQPVLPTAWPIYHWDLPPVKITGDFGRAKSRKVHAYTQVASYGNQSWSADMAGVQSPNFLMTTGPYRGAALPHKVRERLVSMGRDGVMRRLAPKIHYLNRWGGQTPVAGSSAGFSGHYPQNPAYFYYQSQPGQGDQHSRVTDDAWWRSFLTHARIGFLPGEQPPPRHGLSRGEIEAWLTQPDRMAAIKALFYADLWLASGWLSAQEFSLHHSSGGHEEHPDPEVERRLMIPPGEAPFPIVEGMFRNNPSGDVRQRSRERDPYGEETQDELLVARIRSGELPLANVWFAAVLGDSASQHLVGWHPPAHWTDVAAVFNFLDRAKGGRTGGRGPIRSTRLFPTEHEGSFKRVLPPWPYLSRNKAFDFSVAYAWACAQSALPLARQGLPRLFQSAANADPSRVPEDWDNWARDWEGGGILELLDQAVNASRRCVLDTEADDLPGPLYTQSRARNRRVDLLRRGARRLGGEGRDMHHMLQGLAGEGYYTDMSEVELLTSDYMSAEHPSSFWVHPTTSYEHTAGVLAYLAGLSALRACASNKATALPRYLPIPISGWFRDMDLSGISGRFLDATGFAANAYYYAAEALDTDHNERVVCDGEDVPDPDTQSQLGREIRDLLVPHLLQGAL